MENLDAPAARATLCRSSSSTHADANSAGRPKACASRGHGARRWWQAKSPEIAV